MMMHRWILGHQVFGLMLTKSNSQSDRMIGGHKTIKNMDIKEGVVMSTGKCHTYKECAHEVELGSFSLLVFSTSGGMEKAATTIY